MSASVGELILDLLLRKCMGNFLFEFRGKLIVYVTALSQSLVVLLTSLMRPRPTVLIALCFTLFIKAMILWLDFLVRKRPHVALVE
jgi:hypothetical protein